MNEFVFGICSSFRNRERLLAAKKAGAQYIEIGFDDLAQADEKEVEDFLAFSKAEMLPCPTANGMFPGELKLVGPDVDYNAIDEYLERASKRFSSLGGKTVVFGSSRARRCPDGWSCDEAFNQLVTLCKEHIAPVFRKYGLVCAIEPLCRSECNVINTAERGYELCRAANEPEIMLLIDMYHFDTENEPPETIANYKGYLRHIHIANAKNERKYPKFSDTTDYKTFLEMLLKAEYSEKLISLEGRSEAFYEEAKEGFDVLKQL